MKNETLLDSHDTAEYLRIAKGTLDNWRCSKLVRIPYLKIGKRIFYRKPDLDLWLEELSNH